MNVKGLGSIPGLGTRSCAYAATKKSECHNVHLAKGQYLSSNWDKGDSVQFSSVTQSCQTLCDPVNHSTPGLPVHHQLLEFTQTDVHRVSDAIQPSHPLSSPSPPAPSPSPASESFPMSQLFAWGGQSTVVSASASVLPMNIQSCNSTPGHIPGEKHGPKGYMYCSVPCNTVYNSKDIEAT